MVEITGGRPGTRHLDADEQHRRRRPRSHARRQRCCARGGTVGMLAGDAVSFARFSPSRSSRRCRRTAPRMQALAATVEEVCTVTGPDRAPAGVLRVVLEVTHIRRPRRRQRYRPTGLHLHRPRRWIDSGRRRNAESSCIRAARAGRPALKGHSADAGRLVSALGLARPRVERSGDACAFGDVLIGSVASCSGEGAKRAAESRRQRYESG